MEGRHPSDGSALSYPHKSDTYTYRVPTPPRIVVPPPTLNAEAIPQITLHARQSSDYDFLQHVDYHNLIRQNAPLEWTYERRREAQPILPFLCLGPMKAAKDEAWLRREGITMLLGVGQRHAAARRLMDAALRGAGTLGLERHAVDLASNQDLIQAFPRTAALINAHLARSFRASAGRTLGRVLVFCESGNERGAGVVAAYLMETHEDVDYIKAMQLCQAQRFCVNFDDGMKRLLQGYWDILCAQRAVAANPVLAGPGPRSSVTEGRVIKRGLERDDGEGVDGEVDSMEADDAERFGGRIFSPFSDQPL